MCPRSRSAPGGVVLEVCDLHVSYGGTVRALQGVSLTVPDGAVVAVLGSNGAGKSTLLRTISSTLRLHRGSVRSGTITYDGEPWPGRMPRRPCGGESSRSRRDAGSSAG